MKPSYFLKVTYPIAAVMARIHSRAVAMRALRSMVLAVRDRSYQRAQEVQMISTMVEYLQGIQTAKEAAIQCKMD
jgi:hypothetical protein